MTAIQKGSTVSFHFTLHAEKELVESSEGRQPLDYVQGEGQLLPALEAALEGMAADDTKQVTLAPEDGYGPHQPEAVRELPREQFHDADSLAVGNVVAGQSDQGRFQATVRQVGPESITLDFNHPLAGKTLVFDIKVVSVD